MVSNVPSVFKRAIWFRIGTVDIGEVAADEDAAVILNGNGANGIVGPQVQVEVGVHGTVAVHPRDMAQGKTIDVGERAADQQFARERRVGGINGKGIDRAVGAGADGKRRVQRAAGSIEIAAIEAGKVGAVAAADGAERAANVNFPRAVDEGFGQRINRSVGAGTRIEAGVQGTIGHQAGDVIAGNAIDAGERAADDHAAIRLADHGLHGAVGAGIGRCRKPALSSEPSAFNRAMQFSGTPLTIREAAARKNLPVGLQRERQHVAVHARIEGAVRRTGRPVVGFGIQNVDDGIARRTQHRIGRDSTGSR